MNVIMISPGFPAEMTFFTRGLARVGARVIGLGDQPLETLPARADAEPVWNERLDAEQTEAVTQPDFGRPGAGSVVIEQVVIEVVAPITAPVAAPAALSDPRGRAMPSGPQTAEAASLIGPLPISRPFASLYGMRRR